MIPTEVVQFGVAMPLVVALLYLLKQSNDDKVRSAEERREITDKFLLAQKEFAEGSRDMLKEMMTGLAANTAAVHEIAQSSKADHAALLAAVQELVKRETKGTQT